ncbi:MAG: procyclic acidic repetitive family protein, partial [Oscillospiraceae bacterium]|nr:procyclic acidic repetitive family protein [Oscillospiraceae bacterium]
TTGTNPAGGSVHIAVGDDGGESFTDVNHGLGAVYADSENGKARALRSPSVFKMSDDTYGIIAIRTDPSQDADNDNRDGYFLLYTTKDFIKFKKEGFRCIGTKRLNDIACDASDGTYTISWTNEKDMRMCVTTADFESFTEPVISTRAYTTADGMDGAVAASVAGITEDMYKALLNSGSETKYNEYNVDVNHANGNILPDTCDTVFDASAISGSYSDYNITTDASGILPGWSSTWNGATDEATASKQMNGNFITVGGKHYFQFYGPENAAPVSVYTPGYADGADWFAIEFILNSSTTVGCHDSVLLDLNKKPFFGYAYAKYNDGFFPGDGERHYKDDGSVNSTLGGQLSNFLAEIGNASCKYTNGQTIVRIIVDNGAICNGEKAYAVTTAYSDDGASFTVINTRYYSGSVNGFGGITVGALANSANWYDNTRYGNMKVYSAKKNENPPEETPFVTPEPTPDTTAKPDEPTSIPTTKPDEPTTDPTTKPDEPTPTPTAKPDEPTPGIWDYTVKDIVVEAENTVITVSGRENEEITLIAAAYDEGGMLISVEIKRVKLTGKSEMFDFGLNTDGAEYISAYIWNGISDMKALGEKHIKSLK